MISAGNPPDSGQDVDLKPGLDINDVRQILRFSTQDNKKMCGKFIIRSPTYDRSDPHLDLGIRGLLVHRDAGVLKKEDQFCLLFSVSA